MRLLCTISLFTCPCILLLSYPSHHSSYITFFLPLSSLFRSSHFLYLSIAISGFICLLILLPIPLCILLLFSPLSSHNILHTLPSSVSFPFPLILFPFPFPHCVRFSMPDSLHTHISVITSLPVSLHIHNPVTTSLRPPSALIFIISRHHLLALTVSFLRFLYPLFSLFLYTYVLGLLSVFGCSICYILPSAFLRSNSLSLLRFLII